MTEPRSAPALEPMTEDALAAALGFRLTPEQWEIASGPLRPDVVVAGAGSGKTTTMAARVAYLVGSGLVEPGAVLGLTFTTKAAAQLLTAMRSAISAMSPRGLGGVPVEVGEPTVLTYHAFGARLLAENGIRIGCEPSAAILTDGAREQLAYRVVCASTLPLGALDRSPVRITGDLLRLDDELAELAVPPERLITHDERLIEELRSHPDLQASGRELLGTAEQRRVLAHLVVQWRHAKSDRDCLDFADQIRLAADLVAAHADVAADCRERFRIVLLDEYQDTSISQRKLLQTAFGAGHPILAVGDPCQAIYGWRGASVHNIDHFHEHFPAPDPQDREPVTSTGRPSVLNLTQNRRSGPRILAAANRVADPLREVHTSVRELVATADKGPGAVTCALFETYDEELDWVVEQVRLTRQGDRRAGVAWSDIAVLAATGGQLADLDAALRAREIPTQFVGAAALLSQPVIVELRSMLEVIHDPTANPAVVRLLSGPRWRIGARDLAALGRRARDLAAVRGRSGQVGLAEALDDAVAGTDATELVSLSEAIGDLGDRSVFSPQAARRFDEFAMELAELRRCVGDSLPDFVWRVVRTSGLEVEASLGPEHSVARQRNALHAFMDLTAQTTELDGRQTLGAFLTRLADADRLDVDFGLDTAGAADGVQLLTVHKAKGLEFEYVFFPFVAKGAFPGGRGRPSWVNSRSTVPWVLREDADPAGALTSYPPADRAPRSVDLKRYREVLDDLNAVEDRRLAYVAFTRAERGLAVSGHWWGPAQAKVRGPATFLADIHDTCLEGGGHIAHWADPPVDGAKNPLVERASRPLAWPAPPDPSRAAELEWLAQRVVAATSVQAALPGLAGTAADRAAVGMVDQRVAEWDLLIGSLLAEERRRTARDRVVPLPSAVPATLLARALVEPADVAADLVRPMPRRPAPAARRGTAFHTWVETRFGQQSLLDPDDLPGAADADIVDDAHLEALKRAFDRSPFAERVPVAVEAPFAVGIGGRIVTGRIDAVFGTADGFEVVDWKTGSAAHLDPTQLAIYRLAWAQIARVPVTCVDAAFVLVSTGEVIRPGTDALVDELGATTNRGRSDQPA